MNSNQNLLVSPVEKYSKFTIISLWIFSSVFATAQINFGSNFTATSIGFILQDVFLIMFTSWLLHIGLAKRNVLLALPWFMTSTYGLYYNHYKSLETMVGNLVRFRHATALPWITIFIASLALVLRAILILRTIQLSANLWYRKKLEDEMCESIY